MGGQGGDGGGMNRDRKLALLRRADTERDTAYHEGGDRRRLALGERKPITLPHLRFLARPLEDDDDD